MKCSGAYRHDTVTARARTLAVAPLLLIAGLAAVGCGEGGSALSTSPPPPPPPPPPLPTEFNLPGPFPGPVLAFPFAEGYGIETVAGRGGQVIRVTNLNADGPGSFREAIEASGPRIVIFDVSGTITDTRNWVISNSFITVAGQTAPSPGITLRGAGLYIEADDVLVQHIRVRVGDDPAGPDPGSRDGMRIQSGAQRVVVDHCSVSWGVDGTFDIPGSSAKSDLTISNCIISETLENSIHPEGRHSRAMLIKGVTRGALIRTLFMHNNQRTPNGQEATSIALVNNLAYNNGGIGFSLSSSNAGTHRVSVIGSVGMSGPDSQFPAQIRFGDDLPGASEFFLQDNLMESADDLGNNPASMIVSAPPDPLPDQLTVLAAADVEAHLVANAGARPADRGDVDVRLINELTTRSGSVIDSPDETGGWPELTENVRALPIPEDPNGDADGDGYTNIEAWLYLLAACVDGTAATALDADQQESCDLVLP